MTHFVLTRHGQTVWHEEHRYAGSSDVALADRGRARAGRLAEWSRMAGLSEVWASPLSRASTTAGLCAEAAAIPLRTDDRLRELDFGDAEGLTLAEMSIRFPEALASFQEDPIAHHLPGGEHPREAADRFLSCLRAISARRPEGRVLVVAHATVIRLALCHMTGVPLEQYRRVLPILRYCSITEVVLQRDQFSLLQFNTVLDGDTRELPDPAR